MYIIAGQISSKFPKVFSKSYNQTKWQNVQHHKQKRMNKHRTNHSDEQNMIESKFTEVTPDPGQMTEYCH